VYRNSFFDFDGSGTHGGSYRIRHARLSAAAAAAGCLHARPTSFQQLDPVAGDTVIHSGSLVRLFADTHALDIFIHISKGLGIIPSGTRFVDNI
jgi:hypothetical protein